MEHGRFQAQGRGHTRAVHRTSPAPELVDAVMFPRHLLHRGQGVFTMMMLSMSRLADQLIEWQD